MSKISDLEFRYLHKELGADDATPIQYTASGGTVRTAVSTALTEANDYWNGAIVRWDGGANAGLYSNVADFDAATDTLTFDDDLPTAVVSTDTFTLIHGGKYEGAPRIPGLEAAALVNVTGLDLTYASMTNDEGTGTLRFYNASGAVTWQPPGEAEGAPVSVSGLSLADEVTVYGAGATIDQRSKYVLLTRNADALPSGDVADDVSLDLARGSFLAPVTGAETATGVNIYRPVGLRNTAADAMRSVRAYCGEAFPGAASTAVATSIGTGADDLVADDFTGWGTSGFVFNATKNDARYFFDRSGNTVTIADPGAGIRGFTAVLWDIDDVLEPYPWFDIGLDAPGVGSIFEGPATRATAPTGVAFTCPRTAAAGLLIGDMAAGAVHVVWQRYSIPAGMRPVEGGRADLRVQAEVTA